MSASCACTGHEHLDARDEINQTITDLIALVNDANKRHSLVKEELAAFKRAISLLSDRASRVHHHAYEAHGVERQTKAPGTRLVLKGERREGVAPSRGPGLS